MPVVGEGQDDFNGFELEAVGGSRMSRGSSSTDAAEGVVDKIYQSNALINASSLDLPQSIYSVPPVMTCMDYANTESKDDSDRETRCIQFFLYELPYWALLYFTVVCQLIVIYYVNEIVRDQADEDMKVDCSQTPYYLQLVAVGCLTTLTLKDLIESWTMAKYFLALPRSDTMVGIDFFTVDSNGKANGFAPGQGVTTVYAWLMIVLSILPKVAVACGVWHTGSGFLLAAPSSEELLLNAVALVFVLDIDDYIYQGLVPHRMKQFVEVYPPITMTEDEISGWDEVWGVFGMWILWGFIIGMIFAAKAAHCSEIDSFQNATNISGGGYTESGSGW